MRRPGLLGTLGRIVAFLLLTAVELVGVYFAVGWPWLNRWGATDLEAFDVLPGDELVPAQAFVTTLAVTVAAPPESIFPWLLQMGAGRAGLYTYPWLETILGAPVRAAGSIVPEWQELTEGQFVRLANRGLEAGTSGGVWVRHLSPDRALVACRGSRAAALPPGSGSWSRSRRPRRG